MTSNSLMRFVVLLCLCVTVACSKSDGGFVGVPVSPTPTLTSQPFAVDFRPRAIFGGSNATGTITLSSPAPAGGLDIQLSASNNTITVPDRATVPPGALSLDFPVTAASVDADGTATVQADAGGRSASGALMLWAPLPTYFSWISEPGLNPGAGRVSRLTPANAIFKASCRHNTIEIYARSSVSDIWNAYFQGPAGQALRVGAYENASPDSAESRPRMWLRLGGAAPTCTAPSGRFVIQEIELGETRTVGRFRATFEQRCNGELMMRGDLRLTNPPPDTLYNEKCER